MLTPSIGHPFGSSTHIHIANQAYRLFQTDEMIDPAYSQKVLKGAYEEDGGSYLRIDGKYFLMLDPLLYLMHCWNANTNSPLVPLEDTVLERAYFYWEMALNEYGLGNKKDAYELLGHVVHLLSDMAVPVHAHNDPHPEGEMLEGFLELQYPYYVVKEPGEESDIPRILLFMIICTI